MRGGGKEVRNYRDLEVWQRGMELAAQIYEATKGFPTTETYGLTSQLRRAAVSVPSNIAEGHTRASTKEYLRQLAVAHGSISEIDTQLLLARRLGFLAPDSATSLLEEVECIGKMLRRLRQSLASSL